MESGRSGQTVGRRNTAYEFSIRLLRKVGLKVTAPVTGTKFGKQIQHAEKLKAKCVVFCGDDEIKNETFCVKWLATGVQEIFEMKNWEALVDKCQFDVLNLHNLDL